MVTIKEIKITTAVAIACAFGFIIDLICKDIIVGLVNMTRLGVTDLIDTLSTVVAIVTAVILTVIYVLVIVYISKWDGVEKK